MQRYQAAINSGAAWLDDARDGGVASAEGVYVAEKIASVHAEPVPYDSISACTYCSLEIASLGLTEEKAKAAGIPIKVGRMPFRALAKALGAGEPNGFVKVLYHAETGALVGANARHRGLSAARSRERVCQRAGRRLRGRSLCFRWVQDAIAKLPEKLHEPWIRGSAIQFLSLDARVFENPLGCTLHVGSVRVELRREREHIELIFENFGKALPDGTSRRRDILSAMTIDEGIVFVDTLCGAVAQLLKLHASINNRLQGQVE